MGGSDVGFWFNHGGNFPLVLHSCAAGSVESFQLKQGSECTFVTDSGKSTLTLVLKGRTGKAITSVGGKANIGL